MIQINYSFSLFTINSGAMRINNLAMAGVDDSAVKVVESGQSEVSLIIDESSIGHNSAATNGGAISIQGGAEVTIYSSLISTNGAPNGNGGAIYVENSTLNIFWSIFQRNSAQGSGGAIYFVNESDEAHQLTVTGSGFLNNAATDGDDATTDEKGGAINIANAVTTAGAVNSILGSNLSEHSAYSGGAIYLASGALILENNTIDENTVLGKGGGIYVAGGDLTVRHATIVNNRAANGAGIAIFTDDDENTEDPVVRIYNSIVADNVDGDAENSACLADALQGNEGNIIEDFNCSADQTEDVDLRMELISIPGRSLARSVASRYYRLLPDSPAIDSASDGEERTLSTDQTGYRRPEGDGYDVGSYEYRVLETGRISTDALHRRNGNGTGTGTDTLRDIVHTCIAVTERDNGIEVQATHGLRSGVQCQEIGAAGIGIKSVISAGFKSAVDIWGFVEQGVQVCF